MDRSRREVILVALIDALRAQDSWCGETHVQKASFFLQEMAGAETEYDFILYKHGPYSFDLHDEIGVMRASGLITLRMQHPRYGPSIIPEQDAESLKGKFPKTLRTHQPRIDFVAYRFGNKAVTELERLGTAFHVLRELGPERDPATYASRIHELKPHVSIDQGLDAVRTVISWSKEAQEL